MYDSRYEGKSLDYLQRAKSSIQKQIEQLRIEEEKLRNLSQVTHRRTSEQNVYEKRVNNNKKVMKETILKIGARTVILSFVFFFAGSILITNVVPLLIGSVAAGLGISVPLSLGESIWKMGSYDRKNNRRLQNNSNTDYLAISSEINKLSLELREIDRQIRHINPVDYNKSQPRQQVVVTYEDAPKKQRCSEMPGLTVYQSDLYGGNMALYNSPPKQIRQGYSNSNNGHHRI
ncbi:MAG: hypothetical protein PHD02_04410 [Bacilli bacterium]|nr:hypothetical protein [Bacilli bacterium]